MKKYQKTITVYELDGGFFVEVSSQKGATELYLHHKDYGVKTLMYGFQESGEVDEELMLSNIDEYIDDYKEQFFDEA